MAEEVSKPEVQKRAPRRDFTKMRLIFIVAFLAFGIVLDGLAVLYMTANDCENLRCIKTVYTYTSTTPEGETVQSEPLEPVAESKGAFGVVFSIVLALDIMVAGLGFLTYQLVTNILLRRKFRTRLFVFYLLAFLAVSGLIIRYIYIRTREPRKTIPVTEAQMTT